MMFPAAMAVIRMKAANVFKEFYGGWWRRASRKCLH
jgi:hypothetical protein